MNWLDPGEVEAWIDTEEELIQDWSRRRQFALEQFVRPTHEGEDMEIKVTDTGHAEWAERINEDLEYAHGEIRAIINSLGLPEDHVYWKRTDYLVQQVRNHLDALQRSLSGEGEYVPPPSAEAP